MDEQDSDDFLQKSGKNRVRIVKMLSSFSRHKESSGMWKTAYGSPVIYKKDMKHWETRVSPHDPDVREGFVELLQQKEQKEYSDHLASKDYHRFVLADDASIRIINDDLSRI